jgi:AbrB family looped-hinge helix DNA binding protein
MKAYFQFIFYGEVCMHAKVAERGQVTIPKATRDRLGIAPGTDLDFMTENGRLIAVKAEAVDKLEALYGRFGKGRSADEVVDELRDRR